MALKDLLLKPFVAGITNISFTKPVAVYLNEAGPFTLRNSSVMDDTEAMELSRACIFKIVSSVSRLSKFTSEP